MNNQFESQQENASKTSWIAITSASLGVIGIIAIVTNCPFCCSGAISPILGIVAILNSRTQCKYKNDIILSIIGIILGIIYIVWVLFFSPPIGDIF